MSSHHNVPTIYQSHTLLKEKVLYRTLKGSISATYLEPLKGSIHSMVPKKMVLYRTILEFHI